MAERKDDDKEPAGVNVDDVNTDDDGEADARSADGGGAGGEKPADEGEVIRSGEITLVPATREVRRWGRSVRLSPKEFALFSIMVKHRGKPVTRETFLREVWHTTKDNRLANHALSNTMHRLRKKLALFEEEIPPDLPTPGERTRGRSSVKELSAAGTEGLTTGGYDLFRGPPFPANIHELLILLLGRRTTMPLDLIEVLYAATIRKEQNPSDVTMRRYEAAYEELMRNWGSIFLDYRRDRYHFVSLTIEYCLIDGIHDAWKRYGPFVRRRRMRLITSMTRRVMVMVDRAFFEIVLDNLIGCAALLNPPGTPLVVEGRRNWRTQELELRVSNPPDERRMVVMNYLLTLMEIPHRIDIIDGCGWVTMRLPLMTRQTRKEAEARIKRQPLTEDMADALRQVGYRISERDVERMVAGLWPARTVDDPEDDEPTEAEAEDDEEPDEAEG